MRGIIPALKPQTTVVEARRLLGNRYRKLSDDQIRELIFTLTLIARKQIIQIGSRNK